MTIKKFAAQQGVSPQAVYQRLKTNKIKVETITEKGTGELTGEGLVILIKLFDPENRQIKPIKDERIEALEQQLAEARAQISSKEEQIKSLEKERDSLKDDKEYFKQALTQAQTNLSDIKALLPGPNQPTAEKNPEPRRKLTLRERFTGRLDSSSKG